MSNLSTHTASLRLPVFLSLEKVLPLLEAHEVFDVCPILVPFLQAAVADASKAVRKATVSCLATLNDLLGERMVPYMSTLTSDQRKLVHIIMERRQAC